MTNKLEDVMHYSSLTHTEVAALIKQGAQLVDVCSPQEYQHHTLPGSINIPLPLIQRALRQLDKDMPVLLFCTSGQRSNIAKRVLEACGFTQVHNLGSYAFLKDCTIS